MTNQQKQEIDNKQVKGVLRHLSKPFENRYYIDEFVKEVK